MNDTSGFSASLRERWMYWRSQFARLSARERKFVLIGGALALAALGYGLIYEPIQRDLGRLRQALPAERARLETMRMQAQEIKRRRAENPVERAAVKDVPSVVERAASTNALSGKIARIAPEGANAIRVSIESAPFDSIVAWLAELNREHGLRVQNAELEAKAPGQASGHFVLRSPARP